MPNFWEVDLGNVLTMLTIVGMGWRILLEITSIKVKMDILWQRHLDGN